MPIKCSQRAFWILQKWSKWPKWSKMTPESGAKMTFRNFATSGDSKVYMITWKKGYPGGRNWNLWQIQHTAKFWAAISLVYAEACEESNSMFAGLPSLGYVWAKLCPLSVMTPMSRCDQCKGCQKCLSVTYYTEGPQAEAQGAPPIKSSPFNILVKHKRRWVGQKNLLGVSRKTSLRFHLHFQG